MEEIRKLAAFLGVSAPDEFMADVNKAASIENMREGVGKTRENAKFSKSQLKDGTVNSFMRKGKFVISKIQFYLLHM